MTNTPGPPSKTAPKQVASIPAQTEAGSGFERLIPPPRSRSFVSGSSGSGKSTVAGTLLDGYYRRFKGHRIFVIDPKRRFFADRDRDFDGLLPDGPGAVNHGKRDGVSVNAKLLKNPELLRYASTEDRAWVVQDTDRASDLFVWLFKHADVRRPALVYLDESVDFVAWVRADAGLGKLIQMGREVGIGVVVVAQRPKFIDRRFTSEATRLYVGQLFNPDDRKYLADYAPTAVRPHILAELPQYHFWMVDREKPGNSLYFTLKL